MLKRRNQGKSRLLGFFCLGICLGLVAGCNDPGLSSSSIFLRTDVDGSKKLLIEGCASITSIEFAEGDNLVAKSQVEFRVDEEETITLTLGPGVRTGDVDTDRFIAEMKPPFTVWAQTDEGSMASYFLEWPEPGYTIYTPRDHIDAVHVKTSEVPPHSCEEPSW